MGVQGDDNHKSRAALLSRSAAFSLSKRRSEEMKSKITLAMAVFTCVVFRSVVGAFDPVMIVGECLHFRAQVAQKKPSLAISSAQNCTLTADDMHLCFEIVRGLRNAPCAVKCSGVRRSIDLDTRHYSIDPSKY
jgi:hypothetical protein